MSNVLLVVTTPRADHEDAYHQWYRESHIPELQALPYVQSVRRFEATRAGDSGPQCWAVSMEVADDPAEALADIRSRMGSGAMSVSDAMDSTRTVAWFLTATQ
jgi:homoserine kinase